MWIKINDIFGHWEIPQYEISMKMSTVAFTEILEGLHYSTRFIPENWSFSTDNSSSKCYEQQEVMNSLT
jgi:hypothetical protein